MKTDILRGGHIGEQKPSRPYHPRFRLDRIQLNRQSPCDDCGHNTWTLEPSCECICHIPVKDDVSK